MDDLCLDMDKRREGLQYDSEIKVSLTEIIAEATVTRFGVCYRPRLLYKSHIDTRVASKRHLESCFGCLFCIQTSSTVREGDATVFRTVEALITHLARHPQPLPKVPGVSVLYGKISISTTDVDDFDLHFPDLPQPSPVPENVIRLPVAVGIQDHIERSGQKKLRRPPGYDGEMLQFLLGSRIVGVNFPEKWEGKWCLGRHDGNIGAFSAKAVDLQAPKYGETEVPLKIGAGGTSVTTRWKWHPKQHGEVHRAPWLEFDPGEIISNVQCKFCIQ
jgi:hypothetical protein